MLTGPKIKLAVNLHRLDKYFPLEMHLKEAFDYDWIVDRDRYEQVAYLLKRFAVKDDHIIRECCFILLWIKKETQAGEERGNIKGKFYQMQDELDKLKEYLLNNRVTSVTFKGEVQRNKAGEELTLCEDINIDRLCDGVRTIFRHEFSQDKEKRRSKGLTAWQRRKMVKISNNILNYFTSVPGLDKLTLEEQHDFIEKLSEMAGLPD